jgi:hypothetical protein
MCALLLGASALDSCVDGGYVRLAYQPPASSTFLSEQTSHHQPANSIFLSEQTSISHQQPAKRTRWSPNWPVGGGPGPPAPRPVSDFGAAQKAEAKQRTLPRRREFWVRCSPLGHAAALQRT